MDKSPLISNARHGFTLIELMVVLALISLMLFVTIPRLPANPFADEKRGISNWITGMVPALKSKSLGQSGDYTLHVDLDGGRLWASAASATEEEADSARQAGYLLPEGVAIERVEFPDGISRTSGSVGILFSGKGFSRHALVHARFSDGSRRSFLIEPFLQKVKIYATPISFNQ